MTQALKRVNGELEMTPEVEYLCDFINHSERGICKEGHKTR